MPETLDSQTPGWKNVRAYLSIQHLYAAYFAAEQARQEEESGNDSPLSRTRHRGFAISAVTESVCFLEAAINEVLADVAEGVFYFGFKQQDEGVSLLRAIWRHGGERFGILEKYNLIVEALQKGEFSKGEHPYQDVDGLIRLRNYLVHYKPHDLSKDTPHKLEKQLKGKFPSSRLATGQEAWLSNSALGAGCANWAWRSARCFVDHFSTKLDIKLIYHLAAGSSNILPD